MALTKEQLARKRKKNREEMQYQVISFGLMILLTGVAFLGVASKQVANLYFLPFLIVLAVVQVVFQLYYLMHMKEKGHGIAQIFLYTGAFFAVVFVITFIKIVWI